MSTGSDEQWIDPFTTSPVLPRPVLSVVPDEQPPLPTTDPATPAPRSRRKRRDYLAIASLLYGPDLTLDDLANGQIPPDAYTPSDATRTRKPKPSRLPKTVVLSKHLAAARRLSDSLVDLRRAAQEKTSGPVVPVHASNSWIEYADTLIRVAKYDEAQVRAVIAWMSEQPFFADTAVNMFLVRKWMDATVAKDPFRAYALRVGVTFTPAQIDAAQTRASAAFADATPNGRPQRTPRPIGPGDAEKINFGGTRVIQL